MKRIKLTAICTSIIAISVVAIFVVHFLFAARLGTLERPVLAILSALLASSFALLLFEVFLKRDAEIDLHKRISESVNDSVKSSMGIQAAGLVEIHRQMINSKFNESMASSKSVRLLQTYAPNLSQLREAIIEAKSRNADIRILLLDPDSDFAGIRAAETPHLHDARSDFEQGIRSNLSRLRGFSEEHPKGSKIKVRHYSSSPGITIYGTDSVYFVGNFLANKDAVSSPHFEIQTGSWLHSVYEKHFDDLWTKGVDVDYQKADETEIVERG